MLTLVIVRSAGLQLHSTLSFAAKRRSVLHQETPNKDKEVETHRNQSLCSHDLIRDGGVGSSGQRYASTETGNPNVNCSNWGEQREICSCPSEEIFSVHALITDWWGMISLPAIYCTDLISSLPNLPFSLQANVMCPPLQCLNMGFLQSVFGHLRHSKRVYKGVGILSVEKEPREPNRQTTLV